MYYLHFVFVHCSLYVENYGDYNIIKYIVFAGDSLIFVINIGSMVVGFSASCLTSILLVWLIFKIMFEKREKREAEYSNM